MNQYCVIEPVFGVFTQPRSNAEPRIGASNGALFSTGSQPDQVLLFAVFRETPPSSQTLSPRDAAKQQHAAISTALVSTRNCRLLAIVIPDGVPVIPIGNRNFDINVDFG